MNLRVRIVAPSSAWIGLAIERNRIRARWWRSEIFLDSTSRNFIDPSITVHHGKHAKYIDIVSSI